MYSQENCTVLGTGATKVRRIIYELNALFSRVRYRNETGVGKTYSPEASSPTHLNLQTSNYSYGSFTLIYFIFWDPI